MVQLYLSLGSNLGDRWQYLQQAVLGLQQSMDINAISPVYETAPWGPEPNQPHYLNACLGATTTLDPEELVAAIEELEQTLGRQGSTKWGPHEIDIDLLFYGDLVADVGKRTIPHRQISQRAFVLRPLAEIAPEFIHPLHQKNVTDLLAEIDTSGIVRLPDMLSL